MSPGGGALRTTRGAQRHKRIVKGALAAVAVLTLATGGLSLAAWRKSFHFGRDEASLSTHHGIRARADGLLDPLDERVGPVKNSDPEGMMRPGSIRP